MCWEGTVARGVGQDDFENALRTVVSTLDRHKEFLGEFVASGGEVEITINFDLDRSVIPDSTGDDEPKSKIFELALYPEFLAALAGVPALLRVQGWQ